MENLTVSELKQKCKSLNIKLTKSDGSPKLKKDLINSLSSVKQPMTGGRKRRSRKVSKKSSKKRGSRKRGSKKRVSRKRGSRKRGSRKRTKKRTKKRGSRSRGSRKRRSKRVSTRGNRRRTSRKKCGDDPEHVGGAKALREVTKSAVGAFVDSVDYVTGLFKPTTQSEINFKLLLDNSKDHNAKKMKFEVGVPNDKSMIGAIFEVEKRTSDIKLETAFKAKYIRNRNLITQNDPLINSTTIFSIDNQHDDHYKGDSAQYIIVDDSQTMISQTSYDLDDSWTKISAPIVTRYALIYSIDDDKLILTPLEEISPRNSPSTLTNSQTHLHKKGFKLFKRMTQDMFEYTINSTDENNLIDEIKVMPSKIEDVTNSTTNPTSTYVFDISDKDNTTPKPIYKYKSETMADKPTLLDLNKLLVIEFNQNKDFSTFNQISISEIEEFKSSKSDKTGEQMTAQQYLQSSVGTQLNQSTVAF